MQFTNKIYLLATPSIINSKRAIVNMFQFPSGRVCFVLIGFARKQSFPSWRRRWMRFSIQDRVTVALPFTAIGDAEESSTNIARTAFNLF